MNKLFALPDEHLDVTRGDVLLTQDDRRAAHVVTALSQESVLERRTPILQKTNKHWLDFFSFKFKSFSFKFKFHFKTLRIGLFETDAIVYGRAKNRL